MRSKDAQRLMQGVALVAQEFLLTHGPVAATRTSQSITHVQELVSLLPSLLDHRHAHHEPDGAHGGHSGDRNPVPHSSGPPTAHTAPHAHVGAQHKQPPHLRVHGAPPPPVALRPPPPPRRPILEEFDAEDAVGLDHHPKFHERKVPSGPLSRVLGFSQLAAGMVLGTAGEVIKRTVGLSEAAPSASYVMNDANAERLAATLCRMRGAALKVGQMLSIQDDSMLPPVWRAVLERVRQQANIMPMRQLENVLAAELGDDWRSRFAEFHEEPIAAASIGQVHHAVLHNGRHVAVKVQYPGVADSIDSDLDNLTRVISVANVFPKGLYMSNIIDVAREELKMECDYLLEARNQQRYRRFVKSDEIVKDYFIVPKVEMDLCTSRVLTTQLIAGSAIDKAKNASQEERDQLGRRLLRLTLQELFVYRFMQTDPNWGNFLYDKRRDMIGLLDFGAARQFPKHFVDDYLRLVWAAANDDKEAFHDVSLKMGLLTGHESKVMTEAHIEAGMLVGLPFASSEPFDFKTSGMATKVQRHAAIFAEHRLTPPPKEIYSLHRRLSGAFFMCIHLGARFQARDALEDTVANHVWGTAPGDDDGVPDA